MIIPPLVRGLLDDAAVFPPGNASLLRALAEHDHHRDAEHGDLVGPLVLPLSMVAEIGSYLANRSPASLPIVITTGGAKDVRDAVAVAAACAALTVPSVEIPLAGGEVRSQLELIMRSLSEEMIMVIEVPRGQEQVRVLDLLADLASVRPVVAKLRTGGATADLHPGGEELATAVVGCVSRDLPFKATAGLHHAVVGTGRVHNVEQHGFLNLALATHRALIGAEPAAVVEALADHDGHAVARALSELDPTAVVRLRAAFRSIGTCSITDPLAELQQLCLLPSATQPARRPSSPSRHPEPDRSPP